MPAAERPLRSLSFPAALPGKCSIMLHLEIKTPSKSKDLRVAPQAHLTELLDREVSFFDVLDPARDLFYDFWCFDFGLDVTVGVGDNPSDCCAAFAVPLFLDNDLSPIGVSMVPYDVVRASLRPWVRLHTFLLNLFRFAAETGDLFCKRRGSDMWEPLQCRGTALVFVLEEFHDKDVVLIVDDTLI
eukprot:m51a1_g8320 hypothetical protein (186) ;mRNA; r:124160-125585